MEALASFRSHGRVAIAVSDTTRSLDTVAALEALARTVDGPATVVVGLGLHRPLYPEERAPLEAACPWPVVDHDPDACVSLGWIEDTPCDVHVAFAEADTLITVGCVELHQYAGVSGGHKGVVVGCGGRATLNHLHSKAFVCHPDVQVGLLAGNPFRDRVDALGALVGVDLALQWVPGHGWLAGPPTAILRKAANLLDPWIPTPEPVETALLRVPASKAVNFYQASRAATYLALSPSPPLVPGARLVLDAACPEGLGLGSGELAFAELLAETPPPWGSLLEGDGPKRAGGQRALMLARLASRFRLEVAGCENVDALLAAGIEATSRPAEEVAGEGALVVEAPFLKLPQLVPSSG